jgi:hypothetical protein
MDAALGSDVDANRRAVQDQDLRIGREAFADHHTLLVAPGKRLYRHVRVGDPNG